MPKRLQRVYQTQQNSPTLIYSSTVTLPQSAILKQIDGYQAYDKLENYLSSVQTGTSWHRCWRAAEDGWDVEQTFHPQCDGKGPTVTLIRKDGYVYGGYADKSWQSPPSSKLISNFF